MPDVQIHTQRHLLRPKNRCQRIASGQPCWRRKESLPFRGNEVHKITRGIAGEVGECREW